MASDTDLKVLSKLESSNDFEFLYSLVSGHLKPATALINSKNPPKKKQDQSALRSLAKQFLPFINKSLSVLPKRLSKQSPSHLAPLPLFRTYSLCIDCLELFSSQLSCSRCAVHFQRIRLIYCLHAWELYLEAEKEGFRVLGKLKEGGNSSGKFLPDVANAGGDKEFRMVVVESVVLIIKSVAGRRSKEFGDYKGLLPLVNEVRPWFGVLEAKEYERLLRVFGTYLGKCNSFLVADMDHFDLELVKAFSFASLVEYSKPPLKDQIFKFARWICSSIFSLKEKSLVVADALKCILVTISNECKIDRDNDGSEFLELVAYCANKCRTAGTILCSTLAGHLNAIVDKAAPPFHLIVRLYAVGLDITECCVKSQHDGIASTEGSRDKYKCKVLCIDEDKIQAMTLLLESLGSYFCTVKVETSYPTCTLMCLSALKYLCQPLAELVNLEKKQMVSQLEPSSDNNKLFCILNAFHRLSANFILVQCHVTETEWDGFEDKMTILGVALAGFVLSVCLKVKIQDSAHLVMQMIVSEWVQEKELKYLFTSLHNLGLLLYRNKRMEEASEALKLSSRASWACVNVLSQKFKCKSESSNSNLSEDSVIHFVSEACTTSAFALDVLHACDNLELGKIVVDILETWCTAKSSFRGLPGPSPLIKQWVKIKCRLHNDLEVKDCAPTLLSLISSSIKASKMAVCIILEQELHAYEEMSPFYPDFCQQMQMEIISILLQDFYVSRECLLQKSSILIRKGKALRAKGIENLEGCIQCLSEAISIMTNMRDEKSSSETSIFHQLALAHSLRALCTQEAEPNSKGVFQDIGAALDQWLNISMLDAGHELSIVSGSIVLLLYNIMDLLSVKGCTELHGSIYKLMIRLCKLKNTALEKCVANLWECRRLSHGFCASPISDTFIMNFSEKCEESSKYVKFWKSCLNGSQPLLAGLQQNLSFFFNFTHVSNNHEQVYWPEVTVKDVKEVVSELLLINPVPSRSLSLAGYLYYDLSERLMSNGRLLEALTYAKEAYRLRAQLFQEKFRYSVEQQAAEYDVAGNMIQMLNCVPQNLHTVGRVTNEIWSFDGILMDLDYPYLSPWNVLECYLESTLQVGLMHEIVGNGVEAETFLSWGRNIACLQSLPLFEVAFSTALGNIYCKKGLWDLAEKEVKRAKHTINEKCEHLCCLRCKLMLEANVDYQHGNLCWSLFARGRDKGSMEILFQAENLYRSARERLDHFEWKSLVSIEESSQQITTLNYEDEDEEPKAKIDMRKHRTNKHMQKSVLKKQHPIPEPNSRVTRSKNRHAHGHVINISREVQFCVPEHSKDNNEAELSTIKENESLVGRRSSTDKLGREVSCVCKIMQCWHCLHLDVIKSGLLRNFIGLRWDFAHRRLLVRVITGIGKCLGIRGQTHETHVGIMQSIEVLVSRNPFNLSPLPVHATCILDMIGMELPGDAFAIERAAVLYHMCLFSLKNYPSRNARVQCCNMSQIQLSRVVFWLKLSFVLCREAPILFEKVSRLLAAMYLISATSNDFPMMSTCKALSESHWASYFHQASLGINHSYQFFSIAGEQFTGSCSVDSEGSGVTGSRCIDTDPRSLLRLAPESIEGFEHFVTNFFASLPSTAVICISLLGGAYANLLRELLLYPSSVHAWILLSRMDSKSQPVVLLLPVKSVLEVLDDDANSISFNSLEYNLGRRWHCPWDSSFTAVDSVAPEFKAILEENYMSSSICPSEDTKKNRSLWWMRRQNLDHRLGKLLRNIEDSWLGPWRLLLLGDLSCKTLSLAQKKLLRDLKSKCKIKANENLLKLILEGVKYGFETAFLPHLSLENGCFLAKIEEICELSPNITDQLVLQLIHEAAQQLEQDNLTREPIVLVLDREVQMLPWESMPILRNQEIYRMPSVGSLVVTLERSCHYQEKVGMIAAALPLIDPLDAFFLLNPSGDLSSTQVEFENWFRDQRLEGIAGSVPTAEELTAALKAHDLFIYFGHGSGEQYISKHEIQKLRRCAASLLMGCSSGTLSLHGCYVPQGAPLSYLLAGSPVIVANLWEVTDKDIDRFAKAMLDAWLEARVESGNYDLCDILVKEFKEININGCKRTSRRQATSKITPRTSERFSSEIACYHRPRIAHFMGQAREACRLPYLIGASPVCYGVPTGIRKKNLVHPE